MSRKTLATVLLITLAFALAPTAGASSAPDFPVPDRGYPAEAGQADDLVLAAAIGGTKPRVASAESSAFSFTALAARRCDRRRRSRPRRSLRTRCRTSALRLGRVFSDAVSTTSIESSMATKKSGALPNAIGSTSHVFLRGHRLSTPQRCLTDAIPAR